MNAPSGSKATTGEEWVFWNDFTKYERSKKPRETRGNFNDLTVDNRNLGAEDSVILFLSDDDGDSPISLLPDEQVNVQDSQAHSQSAAKRSRDPLGSKRCTANKRAKRNATAGINEFNEVFASLADVLKEETTSAKELNKRAMVDMIMAVLMEVEDTVIMRRLCLQAVEFLEEKVRSLNGGD